jgi:hypothetical protein
MCPMSDWASDVTILGIFFPIEGGQGYPTVDGKSFAMKHLIQTQPDKLLSTTQVKFNCRKAAGLSNLHQLV